MSEVTANKVTNDNWPSDSLSGRHEEVPGAPENVHPFFLQATALSGDSQVLPCNSRGPDKRRTVLVFEHWELIQI